MGQGTYRSIKDRTDAIRRMIRALAKNPSEWELDDLVRLHALEGQIEVTRRAAIEGLRDTGYTDKVIAEALGVTQQAVSKRWPGGRRYVGAAGRYRTNHREQN